MMIAHLLAPKGSSGWQDAVLGVQHVLSTPRVTVGHAGVAGGENRVLVPLLLHSYLCNLVLLHNEMDACHLQQNTGSKFLYMAMRM